MRVLTTLTTACVVLSAVALAGCQSGSKPTAAGPAAPGGPTSSAARSASAAAAASAASGPSAGSASSADLNACSLLTVAQATALVGKQYTGDARQTIATGQDQCTYSAADNGSSLVVIVYEPDSGVTFGTLKSVQAGVGQVTGVGGVGQQAIVGSIELDAQAGERLLAVQGAGGTLTGDTSKAVAVAKAVIAALP
jgi:hypothetical protein